MQAYLINLARRRDRLRKMSKQLQTLGVAFQRIKAVDARLVPDGALAKWFSDNGPLGVIPKGDKCCALSHIRAWQALVVSGGSHGLILEDDVAIDSDAAALLRDPSWIPPSVDLLKIERFGPPSQRVLVGERIAVAQRWKIGRLRSRHTGAAAYIISGRMARTLLNRIDPWNLPVDHLLFNPNNSPMVDILCPYQLTPAIARQCESLGGCTDIESWRAIFRRRDWAYVRREIIRAYFELRPLPGQILSFVRRETTLVRVDDRVGSRPISVPRGFVPGEV
jgi:glycosyl transferase family 25